MAIARTAKTGQNCPESGIWKVQGTPAQPLQSLKTTQCPYDGKAVTWILVQLA